MVTKVTKSRKPWFGGVRLNKQRYLAELRRLLVFMTEEDREAAVTRFGALFDGAGPEGEEELLEQLGSPTKAAIDLSRRYAPGHVETVLPPLPEKKEPEPAPAPVPPKAKREGIFSAFPEFDPPAVGEEGEVVPAEAPADGEEVPAAPAEEPEPEPAPAKPAAPVRRKRERREPRLVVERSMPLGLGIPLFILLFIALGLPLAALVIALSLVFLLPGCACLFCAYLIFVGGLWCMSFIADAILLFGLSFIALALGLFVLWAGIWIAAGMIRLYIRFIRWLAGELLGRKVWTYE